MGEERSFRAPGRHVFVTVLGLVDRGDGIIEPDCRSLLASVFECFGVAAGTAT